MAKAESPEPNALTPSYSYPYPYPYPYSYSYSYSCSSITRDRVSVKTKPGGTRQSPVRKAPPLNGETPCLIRSREVALTRRHLFSVTLSPHQLISTWFAAAVLCCLPLSSHADELPSPVPSSPHSPIPSSVPRPLLHADADGDRIFDDLEARLERADPTSPIPALVLFDAPLAQLDLEALRRRVGGFAIDARFPREAALAVRLTPAQVRAVAALPAVTHVEGDDWLSPARESAVPSFGVTKARDDFRLTGDGDGAPDAYSRDDHTIAVIDTGIDGGHADFAGDKIIAWMDYVEGRPTPYDDIGHGTHVASIAAGRIRNGVGGVAPGAALVGVKVIGKEGLARTSTVVKGIEWCLNNREDLGIRVLNLSLSGKGSGDGTDLMSRAIHECVEAGIVVCVAAGNAGPAASTIPAPGAAPDAITVGTMRDPGKGGFALWTTSGRGPTADGRVKPDLVGPGYRIVAAKAGTADESVALSGSSMATPFVAGVCALMLAAYPELTPAEVKEILRRTALDFGPEGPDNDYGAGRLDAFAALREAAAPSDPNVGDGPPVPTHRFFTGSLETESHEEWEIEVFDTRHPIAAVLIIPGWTRAEPARYSLQLLDPDGRSVAIAGEEQRSQFITFQPEKTGAYTLRVDAISGRGPYFLDASFDAANGPPEDTGGARG
jgi:serine protease AprX